MAPAKQSPHTPNNSKLKTHLSLYHKPFMRQFHTKILHINPQHPEPELLAEAAGLLHAGKLVAFPTETVYGLGANAFNMQALAAIFEAKGRPTTDPLIVHLADLSQLEQVAQSVPDLAFVLAQHFWPGPLTMVLRRTTALPALVSAGLDTVAVRIPAHPIAHALLARAHLPVAAPSANRFARPSPTTAAHVLADLGGHIPMLIDGGPSTIGVESTILDLSHPEPVLLRPGGVALEDLRVFLPNLPFLPRYLDTHTAASAPGGMLRHYAPDTPLTLFTGGREAVMAHIRTELVRLHTAGQHVGVLLPDDDLPLLNGLTATVYSLGPAANLNHMAKQLFAGLRELDTAGLDQILTRDLQHHGLGLAIWDRLLRAADGRVIKVG